MTVRTERRGEWIGYWPAAEAPGLVSVERLLELVESPGMVLKEDHRTFLKRVNFSGLDVVAKQPRDKNRRAWIRMLSLVRRSEVRFTLDTLEKFADAGVHSVSPLAALERRRFGVVIDSWLFYRYRDGVKCGVEHLAGVMEVLNALHRGGFRHEDPHFSNFLHDGREVFVVDVKGKPRLGRISDYYDYMLFEKHTGISLAQYVDRRERDWSYRMAATYGAYREWRKKAKEWFRRKILRRTHR